jgi:hypothetical protein
MAKPKEQRSDLSVKDPTSKKIGRPTVAEDAKRSTLVRVLTTEAEYETMKQAAAAASMSVSTWMRTIALEHARR